MLKWNRLLDRLFGTGPLVIVRVHLLTDAQLLVARDIREVEYAFSAEIRAWNSVLGAASFWAWVQNTVLETSLGFRNHHKVTNLFKAVCSAYLIWLFQNCSFCHLKRDSRYARLLHFVSYSGRTDDYLCFSALQRNRGLRLRPYFIELWLDAGMHQNLLDTGSQIWIRIHHIVDQAFKVAWAVSWRTKYDLVALPQFLPQLSIMRQVKTTTNLK